jgi:hypothetical protein
MDGTFPLLRDPDTLPRPDVAQWAQEIDEHRAGTRARVSTKAAAHYLGVHYKTLLEWVRSNRGPQPVKNQAAPGSPALNQRMGFTLEALDAFIASRSGDVLTRGRRTDVEDVRQETARIEAAIALKEAEDQLARARARAKRLGVVCFATLTDAMEIHPWAMGGDKVVGHLWTLDEQRYARIDPEDAFEGTLEEALSQPWESEADRAPFHEAMNDVLTSAFRDLEAARTRQRGLDLDARLDEPTASAPERIRPLGGGRF